MYVSVQTKWMKDSLIEKGISKDKIIISKPKLKEFDVNEMIYNKYEEQSFGILEYSGKNFIAFSEIKK